MEGFFFAKKTYRKSGLIGNQVLYQIQLIATMNYQATSGKRLIHKLVHGS
jgi:hypothetical protein